MISGRQALHSIDETLGKVQSQIDKIEQEMTAATTHLVSLQQAQAEDYRNLARVRLDRLTDPELEQQFDRAEHQVLAILQQRDEALDALQKSIGDARERREQLEASRREHAETLDALVAGADAAEAKTQARLDQDTDYREQRAEAQEAERKALHADEKALRSEQEREQKGEAYRQDPLFVYLWERGYGLPGYRATGIIRWLDGKVAHLIGFADARANYARLDEIPGRLREHALHLRALADTAFDKLHTLDERAREQDGIPDLDAQVAAQQEKLDRIDHDIDRSEQADRELSSQMTRYATGDDEYTHRAAEFLANELRREELLELRHDALSTPYPEDDLIVSRMLQREQEQTQLLTANNGLKEALEQQHQRMLELQSLRADFKRSRYDRSGSQFSNESIIPVLLGQFLAGMLDRGKLWKVLQEQQRYRPKRSDTGFGSGNLGRGTVWRGGLGDLGEVIGGIGRGKFGATGRGGGGGFRSGGGF